MHKIVIKKSDVIAVFVQANPQGTGAAYTGTAVKNLVEVDLGFIHAFLASLSVIIVSELGDKTFFIAAILAMRNPRLTVFTGAMLALGLMTVLSGMSTLTLWTCGSSRVGFNVPPDTL